MSSKVTGFVYPTRVMDGWATVATAATAAQKRAEADVGERSLVVKTMSGQQLPVVDAATELEALEITGAAGVRRGANRAQFGADGWALMKADGTPIGLKERAPAPVVAKTVAANDLAPPAPSLKTSDVTKQLVYGCIEKLAADMRATEPSLTREQAIVRVIEIEPVWKELHRVAPDAPPVAKSEPSPFPRSRAYEALKTEALQLRRLHTDLTEAQAIAKASELRPDLVEQYKAER